MDEIDIKKKKIIYLNCGHVYHTDCLQKWVKTNVSQGDIPNCPKCRKNIIENYAFNKNYDYDYDSDSDSESYA